MNQAQRSALRDPSWWNDEHSTNWERVKKAMRRDWEQTKADVSDGGQELNQSVGDTVRQAMGKEPIPPGGFANPDGKHITFHNWDDVEPAVRYGYGARQFYGEADWNDDLESKLRKDWTSDEEGSWDKVKHAVHRGWDSVKRAV